MYPPYVLAHCFPSVIQLAGVVGSNCSGSKVVKSPKLASVDGGAGGQIFVGSSLPPDWIGVDSFGGGPGGAGGGPTEDG